MRGEYRALFPEEAPDTEAKAGKADLLAAFGRHLAEWGPMLQRFLRDEDDQVSAFCSVHSSNPTQLRTVYSKHETVAARATQLNAPALTPVLSRFASSSIWPVECDVKRP